MVPQMKRSSKPDGVPMTTRQSVGKSRWHIWHFFPLCPTGGLPIGTSVGDRHARGMAGAGWAGHRAPGAAGGG